MLIAKNSEVFSMPKHGTSKKRTPPAKKSAPVSVFCGALFALIFGLLLLLFFTFILMKLPDPERFAPVTALVSLFASAAFAGFLSARLHGENGLVLGLLSGIFLSAVLVLLLFALSLSVNPTLFFICAPAAVITSALAGLCGVNSKAGKRRKNRKHF